MKQSTNLELNEPIDEVVVNVKELNMWGRTLSTYNISWMTVKMKLKILSVKKIG